MPAFLNQYVFDDLHADSRLTRITVKVKVVIRVAVTLVLEPSLLRSWAVSEWDMPVTKVLEEVNLLLG